MATQTELSEWQRFFDAHAPRYMENVFTKNTVQEVDFFLSLYALSTGATVLDVGCGTGRHSIELARRGFKVTGIDLSKGMLDQARIASANAGVKVEWVQADATKWRAAHPFEAAICLCEGAIGLIEHGENADLHDSAIFQNIAASLCPNAPFLLTCMNGYAIIRQMNDEQVQIGRFDPATMYASYEDEWTLPEGKKIVDIYERLFIAPEVTKMLNSAGFVVDNVFGGTAGNWSRRPLSLDEIEAMFVCRKNT